MLEVSGQDYVRAARVKGLRINAVILKHALRNALLSIITVTFEDCRANSLWRLTLRRILRQRSAAVGLVILSVLLLIAIFAPLLAPYDPEKVFIVHRFHNHWVCHCGGVLLGAVPGTSAGGWIT
ncbi:MAG: hypothetical protein JXA21_30100 [Anaerolineae bacterium]|nr:hypothetical protein [Anaerolineae bacterium]